MLRRLVRQETALRADDIVNYAFKLDKRNAAQVIPAKLDETPTGYRMTTLTKEPRVRVRRHVVRCDMEPGYSGSFARCPNVKLLCDCGRFKFVWNYALLEHGGAILDLTNGEPPVVKNPREIPGCCKHAVVMLRVLIKQNPRWNPPKVRRKPIRLTTLHEAIRRVRGGK